MYMTEFLNNSLERKSVIGYLLNKSSQFNCIAIVSELKAELAQEKQGKSCV